MDENDSTIESNETGDNSNACNVSDNKLTQYMLINKELSKTLVVLRAENARLRNNNKELNLENLTYRNELTSNRTEIMTWRKRFNSLQAMHVQHVETLTTELQSYANKLTDVFSGNDDENGENEAPSRITEQHSAVVSSLSIFNDCDGTTPPPRNSRSSEESGPIVKQQDLLDDNPSALNTINEADEDDIDASDSEQISLVTSTHESTLTDETTTIPESICESEETKTLIARNSLSDSSAMTSMDSNKENEGPSSFFSPKSNKSNGTSSLTIEDSLLSTRSNKTVLETTKKSITPLREKFITQRRTQKRKTEQTSFEDTKTPELVSSTPYKRKRIATHSDVGTPPPVKANDSTRMTRRTTISCTRSGRPKRSVCPVNFVEPKLNTKLRRPRTYDK